MSQKIKKINEKNVKPLESVVVNTLTAKYLWMSCPGCGKEILFDTNSKIDINIGDGFEKQAVPGMLFYRSGKHKKDCKWRNVK